MFLRPRSDSDLIRYPDTEAPLIDWLLAICIFWLVAAVFFGGIYDAETGSPGRQVLGLLLNFAVFLGIFAVLRLALGGLGGESTFLRLGVGNRRAHGRADNAAGPDREGGLQARGRHDDAESVLGGRTLAGPFRGRNRAPHLQSGHGGRIMRPDRWSELTFNRENPG